jgi:asparagine synthase (glutamine-hydrolysing)
MKQSAAGRLPESIIHRPKSGMRVPVYHWFNGPLKGLAKKLLSKKNVRAAGIFDPERVHEIVNMSTEESGSRYGIWLWMLVTFELWRLKVIEGDDC